MCYCVENLDSIVQNVRASITSKRLRMVINCYYSSTLFYVGYNLPKQMGVLTPEFISKIPTSVSSTHEGTMELKGIFNTQMPSKEK